MKVEHLQSILIGWEVFLIRRFLLISPYDDAKSLCFGWMYRISSWKMLFGYAWVLREFTFKTDNFNLSWLHRIENCMTSSHPGVFYKKRCFFEKKFKKFTGKHLCQSLFFHKVYLKKRLWHRCFLVNFEKYLRTSFFVQYLRWLHLLFLAARTMNSSGIN